MTLPAYTTVSVRILRVRSFFVGVKTFAGCQVWCSSAGISLRQCCDNTFFYVFNTSKLVLLFTYSLSYTIFGVQLKIP